MYFNITKSKPSSTGLPTHRFLSTFRTPRPHQKNDFLLTHGRCVVFRSAQRSLCNLKRIKDPERRDLHVPLSSGVRYLVIVAVVGSEVRKTSCESSGGRVIRLLTNTVSSRLPPACSYFPSRRPIDSWHAVSLQPQKVIPGSKECVF